jgi:hypothetical protein
MCRKVLNALALGVSTVTLISVAGERVLPMEQKLKATPDKQDGVTHKACKLLKNDQSLQALESIKSIVCAIDGYTAQQLQNTQYLDDYQVSVIMADQQGFFDAYRAYQQQAMPEQLRRVIEDRIKSLKQKGDKTIINYGKKVILSDTLQRLITKALVTGIDSDQIVDMVNVAKEQVQEYLKLGYTVDKIRKSLE